MVRLSHTHAVNQRRDDLLDRPLALAAHLLNGVNAFARQLSELGAIDLPPVVRPAADRGHIQTAATLYLASELEAARLVPAVETMAGLFAGGALRIDGQTASLLHQFWQGRHERFSGQERQAFFARLFGQQSDTRLAVSGSRNREFEAHLFALAEAVVSTQPDPIFGGRPVSDAALAVAVGRLAHSLVLRSGGIAGFAARDILKTIEKALAILKLRPIQAALGSISVWTAVQAVARNYLQETVNVSAHVQRGKSGMLLLIWVAEILPDLDLVTASGRLISPEHHIVNAAVTWLQATLELQETGPAWQSAQGLPFPSSGALAPVQR